MPRSSATQCLDLSVSRLVVLALLLMVLGGCRAEPEPARGAQTPDGRLTTEAGGPDGKRFLAGDASQAKALGAAEVVMIAVEAGAPGDRIDGTLRVPDTSCVLVIARGGQGVDDIDLFAYADDGAVLGSDEKPDKTPSLMICPPHPGRVYVSARVAGGQGLVAVGGQLVDPRIAERMAAELASKAGKTKGSSASRWLELDGRLAEHRARLGSEWSDVRRVAVPVDPRTPTVVSGRVEADRCLDFLVVPGDEIGHLSVQLEDEGGRILGQGASLGRSSHVVVCSPERTSVTLKIRPHAGRGLVAVLISRSAVGADSQLERHVIRRDAAALESLPAARKTLARALAKARLGAPQKVGKGELKVGRRHGLAVELPAGCQRLDVVVGKPTRGLRAWLWSETGALLGETRGGPVATLFRCGKKIRARLELEADARGGPYVVERRQPRGPKPAVVDVLRGNPLAASRLLAALNSRGQLTTFADVGMPVAMKLTPEHKSRVKRVLPPGHCLRATLATGRGASGVQLQLVNRKSGEIHASAHGNNVAHAQLCSPQRSILELDVETRSLTGTSSGLLTTQVVPPKKAAKNRAASKKAAPK